MYNRELERAFKAGYRQGYRSMNESFSTMEKGSLTLASSVWSELAEFKNAKTIKSRGGLNEHYDYTIINNLQSICQSIAAAASDLDYRKALEDAYTKLTTKASEFSTKLDLIGQLAKGAKSSQRGLFSIKNHNTNYEDALSKLADTVVFSYEKQGLKVEETGLALVTKDNNNNSMITGLYVNNDIFEILYDLLKRLGLLTLITKKKVDSFYDLLDKISECTTKDENVFPSMKDLTPCTVSIDDSEKFKNKIAELISNISNDYKGKDNKIAEKIIKITKDFGNLRYNQEIYDQYMSLNPNDQKYIQKLYNEIKGYIQYFDKSYIEEYRHHRKNERPEISDPKNHEAVALLSIPVEKFFSADTSKLTLYSEIRYRIIYNYLFKGIGAFSGGVSKSITTNPANVRRIIIEDIDQIQKRVAEMFKAIAIEPDPEQVRARKEAREAVYDDDQWS